MCRDRVRRLYRLLGHAYVKMMNYHCAGNRRMALMMSSRVDRLKAALNHQHGETKMEHLKLLQALGTRFHGVTLEFRRSGTDWPQPWRVRCISTKNERENYRVECFGDTAEEAIEKLVADIAEMDQSLSA